MNCGLPEKYKLQKMNTESKNKQPNVQDQTKSKTCIQDQAQSKSCMQDQVQNKPCMQDQAQPYKCSICGFEFSHSKHVVIHVINAHTTPFASYLKCEGCDTVLTAGTLTRHLKKSHITEKETECKCFCGMHFVSRDHLVTRIKVRHENGVKLVRYMCEVCHVCHADKEKVGKHIVAVHSKRINSGLFQCITCLSYYTDYTVYCKHLHKHVTNIDVLRCSYCYWEFFDFSSFTEHPCLIPLIKCKTCDTRYSSIRRFTLHIKCHQDLNIDKYKQSSRLSMMVKASKQKTTSFSTRPYSCIVCNQNFISFCDLTRHMAGHISNDPHCCIPLLAINHKRDVFYCLLCKKSMLNMNDKHIKYHFLNNNEDETYQCQACEESFSTFELAKIHFSIHWAYIEKCGHRRIPTCDCVVCRDAEHPHRCVCVCV